jgi:hypothetical protein
VQRVRGYTNKYGKRIKPYTRRGNPRSQTNSLGRRRRARASAKGRIIIATITSVVTAAGISLIVELSLSSGPSVSNDSADSHPSSVESSESARIQLTRTQAVLEASSYKVNLDLKYSKNCATDSYGLVHRFFLSHPCKWLVRASFAVRGNAGSVILVAISWVHMTNNALAKEYKRLVDAPGTGNVLELSRQSGRYQEVRFTGRFYESGMVGTSIWNAQAQPIGQLSIFAVKDVLKDSRE